MHLCAGHALAGMAVDRAPVGLDDDPFLAQDCLEPGHADAPVVGVNSRNLHDLSIDAGRLGRLIESIPAGRTVVAESGIGGRADLEALPNRADAVLIGSAFMAAPDPARKLEELGW